MEDFYQIIKSKKLSHDAVDCCIRQYLKCDKDDTFECGSFVFWKKETEPPNLTFCPLFNMNRKKLLMPLSQKMANKDKLHMYLIIVDFKEQIVDF